MNDAPLRDKEMVDHLADQFERDFREGSNPSIEAYLAEFPELRVLLLTELFALELELRRSKNDEPSLDEYIVRFPNERKIITNCFNPTNVSATAAFLSIAGDAELEAISSDDSFETALAPSTNGSHYHSATVGSLSVGQLPAATAEELVSKRYEIEGEVARGGMGVVYKARHKVLDMPAAIKMMLPGASPERFIREARLLASVNSPYVVRVYDFDVLQDHRHLICMEWIEGSDLGQHMANMDDHRIPEHQAVTWMQQAATGLADASKLGITHRDVKPSNILIDRNGHARVADFGLARSPHEALGQSNVGQILGTPYYMSPEQAEDPQSVDTRSDIYSFGATFYHALTGRVPFDGSSMFSILFKHKTEPLVSPRSSHEEISESVSQLIEKCLAKSPNDRFQSFEELNVHLQQLSTTGFHWAELHDDWLTEHLQYYNSRRESYLSGTFESDDYLLSEGRVLRVVKGDIAEQDVDAIVSSEDSLLSMSGGMSGAIAEKAGDEYVAEARAFAPVRLGRTIVTRGGNLPARFVFHAITLRNDLNEIQLPSRDTIAELINGCFYHADTLGIRSIAFPLLATGIAGFSKTSCLDMMFRIIARKLLHGVTCVEEARIVRLRDEKFLRELHHRIRKRGW